MGTYLTAELQENETECQNKWETVATFEFWKSYDLMAALSDMKPEESVKPYGVDSHDIGYAYRVFAPSELMDAIGQEWVSTIYLALLAATEVFAGQLGSMNVRIVFWLS